MYGRDTIHQKVGFTIAWAYGIYSLCYARVAQFLEMESDIKIIPRPSYNSSRQSFVQPML